MAGELDSGGSGGGSDGSDSSGSTSSANEIAAQSLGLGWLVEYEDVLRGFGQRPIQFIGGAILTLLLGGLETIVVAFLEAVGALADAVAALPLLVADSLTGAGGAAGDALLSAIIGINESLLAAVQVAGPLAPAIATGIVVIEIIAVVYVLRTLVRVLIDAIPGGGGLL